MNLVKAVMGIGPRTGTTFVMESLYKAGLPVFWTEKYSIPGAGYDIHPDDFGKLKKGNIAKIWPTYIGQVQIEKAVVLIRDFESQLRSLVKQMAREERAGYRTPYTPEDLILMCKMAAKRIDFPVLTIETKNLDRDIWKIVEWMGEPIREVA